MAVRIDKARVAARQAQLERARSELKAFFVGIDAVIDQLCDGVAVWYTMPEVLTRPVIVNLWGMTGVGKTDLVRRLVQHLEYQEHFLEIELSNADSTTWHSSVASRLSESRALEGEPAILLFDEVQRFNTIDGDGDPVANTKFSDFWELLSDGRLARREREDLDYLFASMSATMRDRERRRNLGEDVGVDNIGVWQAQSYKSRFGLEGDLESLAQLTNEQAFDQLQGAREQKAIFEPLDCTKCLIIISGNLDEAFSMASQGGETDIDADIFHAFTSKITLVDIKNALLSRFKPEQVARFGNVHLIYKSLGRASFDTLIDREIARVTRNAAEHFGIKVTCDESLHHLIYRNGVFPVQGVRPVFSTVGDVLENNLAKFLFDAVLNDEDSIELRYDQPAGMLIGLLGTDAAQREIRIAYTGRVDSIRDDAVADKVANIAVHEAGHALAYCILFGLAPLQLTARVASTYVGGFTFPHSIYETRESLINSVKVLLAGGIAEELIFGIDNASIGRRTDREALTSHVIDFVRRYGFDNEFQANYMLNDPYSMQRSVTEADIEKMVTRLASETLMLLSEQKRLLAALAVLLSAKGQLSASEIAEFVGHYGVRAEVKPEGHQWIPAYKTELDSI